MQNIDPKNDIVLTPDYFADLMCEITNVKNKVVIDNTAGAGALLQSAVKHECLKVVGVEISDLMFPVLEKNITELNAEKELLHSDGMNFDYDFSQIDCLLSNPPYSGLGKGLCFPEYVMRNMTHGTGTILITSSAGYNKEYTAKILSHSTLKVSIKCPDIFKGNANVQTHLFIFDCEKPHKKTDKVKFIDFSNDGYTRSGRKSQKGKVIDTDNAEARYEEIKGLCAGIITEPTLYKDCYIEDTVSLDGGDWTYNQHNIVDTRPTLDDFKKTVADYMECNCKRYIEQTLGTDYVFTKLVCALGIDPRKL